MASSANVFCDPGFVDDGFFDLLVIAPVVPVILDLGSPGDAVHSLPFRSLGGSVVDHDLLYGLLGDGSSIDVQPLFVLATRTGLNRVFGKEIPRQAILDVVIEAYATLLEVEDFIVEGNPAGTNLFGSVALTTRPMSTVTLDNSDGYWTELDERELLLGSPAGFYWDLNHAVLLPELRGVVSAVVIDGTRARLTFGFASRKTNAPSVTD